MIRLHTGDCREILKTLDADSVDACVTDPPYELDFMGKAWDRSGVAFDPATWREVFRVLKPGAHLLAFGGTRTHHRLIVAIEDAGFEIRDCLGWLYGSGFPKSLDVAKAIDKKGGNPHLTAEIGAALKSAREKRGVTITEADAQFCGGSTLYSWYEGRPAGQQMPTSDTLRKIATEWVEIVPFVERVSELEREILGAESASRLAVAPGQGNERPDVTIERTAAASNLARAWAGWGTALKPAWEPVCMARKPFRGTVAENVARHGVGAVNIDGCRIATGESSEEAPKKPLVARNEGAGSTNFAMTSGNRHPAGRWPANIMHDGSDDVVALFPNEAGGGFGTRGGNRRDDGDYGLGATGETVGFGDAGSAARFFYCAKTSPAERDDGLAHLDPVAFARSTGAQTAVAAGAEYQTETGGGFNRVQRVRNTHPTVKPTDLMGYLCRLVTPPGGTVLDPFCGSGSTGRGAVREQFHFVGIDLDPQNIAIAEARIHAAAPLFARAAE